MEQERLKIYQLFKDDEVITKLSYADFIKKYFSSEATVRNLYNFVISNKSETLEVYYYTKSIEDFFKKYACDILPTSNYCVQEGFPKCASRQGRVEKSYFGFGDEFIKFKATVWDKPEILLFKSIDGKTGKYKINSGSKEDMTGTYSCTSTGKLFLGEPTGAPKKNETTPEKETPKTDQKKQDVPKEPETSKTTIPLKRSEKNTKISGSDAIIY